MSLLSLSVTNTKYSLLETFRIPIAVIGSLAFPTLAFVFFVLPQRVVVDNPTAATAAVASMIVFAFMSNALFSFGLDLAAQRATPWVPYLRTLPGAPASRIIGLTVSTLVMSLISMIPLLFIGAFFTAANPDAAQITFGIIAVVLTSIPSCMIGVIVGSIAGQKAAIAITQVLMFTLAFAGGLFLPPMMFPEWLNIASATLPVRQAREIVIGITTGAEIPLWAILGIIAWTIVLSTLAVWVYRHDEGRRYR